MPKLIFSLFSFLHFIRQQTQFVPGKLPPNRSAFYFCRDDSLLDPLSFRSVRFSTYIDTAPINAFPTYSSFSENITDTILLASIRDERSCSSPLSPTLSRRLRMSSTTTTVSNTQFPKIPLFLRYLKYN